MTRRRRRSRTRPGTWAAGSRSTRRRCFNKGLELIEAHHLFGVPYERDRRRRPPAVDRPRADPPERRRLARPPRPPRHAGARSPTRSTTPTAPTCRCPALDLAAVGELDLRGARPGAVPVPAPGPRGRRGRRHRAVRAQRRRRGRRRGVPRRADPVHRRSPRSSSSYARGDARGAADALRRPLRRRRRGARARASRRSRGVGGMSWVLAFAGFAMLVDPARGRPLRRRQGSGHEGREVLPLLPAEAVLDQARRDRVRDRRDPARGAS